MRGERELGEDGSDECTKPQAADQSRRRERNREKERSGKRGLEFVEGKVIAITAFGSGD